MKVCTCFLLFGIFAYTNSVSVIRSKGDHRVVNLQETVKEYSNEEYSRDINNLDSVHNYITKGTTVQDIKLVLRVPRVETLTDFIQEAIKILITYEDTAIEDFFHFLDTEIRKYHYKDCKFSELTQNSDTRSLLARSLKLIRGKSASFTKANINEVADTMRDEKYDKSVKELLSYINSLYTNTELNFHSLLHELKYYRNTKSVRTNNNLVQVIRNGVRAILFNPYSELDSHTRRELKERIETFWKQFKNKPASSAEMNDIPYIDPVINSSGKIIKVGKNPDPYYRNDPQVKSKNKEKIISFSTGTLGEQSQGDETEKDESSNESGKQITNSNTDEISSGQSFDSSSNSIKNSQERHEDYNTQRYVTLYTEEISYKAKTTKKTEIIPISANVITRRPKVKKRSTTTSIPRESDVSSDRSEKLEMLRANNHDTNDTELNISNSSYDTESGLTLETKQKPKVRANYDKQQKQGKADVSRSKSKYKNMEIISDVVIDVQLANTELLKSLGIFEPLGVNTRYDTTLYSKYAVPTEPVRTKSTIRPRSIQAQAEIRPLKPTATTKPPSRYSKRNKPRKQYSLRKNRAPLRNEGHQVDQFMTDKNQSQKYLRSSDNDTIGADDFNTYVIKKINAMENKLNKLEQMNDFNFRSTMNDSNSNEVKARNVTDKFEVKHKVQSKRKDMKGEVTERLLNEDYDLNNEKVNDEHDFPTRNNTMNTKSTNNTKSHKLNTIKKGAVKATVFDSKNTTQVTKINVKVTKKLSKEVTYNISLVKVTNETSLESVVTTHTVGITRKTMGYSEPSYYYDSQQGYRPTVRTSTVESFHDQINDSELRM